MQAWQDFRLGGGFARSIAEKDFIAGSENVCVRLMLSTPVWSDQWL
jgi:hypothetical protein